MKSSSGDCISMGSGAVNVQFPRTGLDEERAKNNLLLKLLCCHFILLCIDGMWEAAPGDYCRSYEESALH